MGATNFETTARGKTVNEAFRNAVDDAHYEHGHGGYSGTIAEKPGVAVFDIPLAEMPERLYSTQQWDKTTKTYKIVMVPIRPCDRLSNAICWYFDNRGYWDQEKMKPVECDPFTREFDASRFSEKVKPEHIEQMKEIFYANRADAEFLVRKMGKKAWHNLCETYSDKWGNAVAIKIGDDEWLFMGMASC